MTRLVLLLFALLPSLASAQVLTRVVALDIDSGALIDGVTIQLQPVDSANPTVEAVTTSSSGSRGTATFEDIAPGTYYAFAAPGSEYATLATFRVQSGTFAAALPLRRFDAEAGRLEGLATDAETGEALKFAQLRFEGDIASGDSLLVAATDAEGRYAIPAPPGLLDGEAFIEGVRDGRESGYAPLSFTVTVASGAPTVLNLAFEAEQTGTIAGRVTDAETGQPLANATVTARSVDGGTAATARTDDGGAYTLGVRVGTYAVGVQASGYVGAFYDGAATEAEATPLAVSADDAITGIDLALAPAPEAFEVSVEGTVSREAGGTITGVYATLFTASGGVIAQDSARADGTYRLTSTDPRVANSAVKVCFRSTLYVFECYDNAPTISAATPLVTGSEPITFTGIDAVLQSLAQGTVSGRVTDQATGEGIAQAIVRALPIDNGGPLLTITDGSGNFRFDALIGEYVVGVQPPAPYVGEFYDDASTLATATPVTISDGATTSGVDFTLARVSSDFSVTIQGTVTDADGTPVRGAAVTALDPERFVGGLFAITDGQGRYSIASANVDLAGARLAVGAVDTTATGQNFQFYNGQPTIELADRLEIGTEAITFSGIDFVLSEPDADLDGLAISGTVRSKVTDAPLGGATIIAVRTDAPGFRAITTGASGSYRLDGLAPGTYTLLFTAREHTPEFYPGAQSWQEGQPITLDGDVTNVNALIGGLNRPVGAGARPLAPFVTQPALVGAVQDASGPLRGALVVARDASGAATAFALTDGSGEFEMESLPSASVALQVDLARYAVERRILNPNASAQLISLAPQVTTAEETTPEASGAELSVYPNPARTQATVAFTLSNADDIRVAVYDVLGREVAVLAEGPLAAGAHEATVGTASMAPGLYVVRVESEASMSTARFTVIR